MNGQSLVLLLLVTDKVSIPVGVEFYMPDPKLTAWNREDKRLKQAGVPKKERPALTESELPDETRDCVGVTQAVSYRVFRDFHSLCAGG